MDISRRVFIQSTVAGGAALSAFGFDVTPVYAQAKTLKIARTTETRSTCPVLLRQLRRDHPHARRQGEERRAAGRPRRGRSRTIRSIAARSARRARRSSRTSSTTGASLKPQVRRPGSDHWEDIAWDHGPRRDRAAGEEDARRDVRRERRRAAASSTAAKASPSPAAAPTRTNSTTSSSRRCAAWGSATWRTRPGFDTARRSPVWGPHSDAAR